MEPRSITDILSANELNQAPRTIVHFLQHPGDATGEETGRSFRTLSFGQPLPLELVLGDWRTALNEGTGGREHRNGDCFSIYRKVYGNDAVTRTDVDALLGTIIKHT